MGDAGQTRIEVGQSSVPDPGWATLFCSALSGLIVYWMPIALIEQIDALRVYRRAREIADDLALLSVLLALVAMFLMLVARGFANFAIRLGQSSLGRRVAWAITLMPVILLCIWQMAFGVKRWIELLAGRHVVAPHGSQVVLFCAAVSGLAFVAWRVGFDRLVNATATAILSVRYLAIALLSVALIALAYRPPLVLRSTSPGPTWPPAGIASPRPPDIFLITLDSLSDVDVALCSNGPALMPYLRQFADGATCFSRAYATSNFTVPTTASIETGALPWAHWATQIGSAVVSPYESGGLATQLRARGYVTYSLSSNVLASPRHRLTYRSYDVERVAPSRSIRSTLLTVLTIFPDSSLPNFVYAAFSFLGAVDEVWNSSRNPDDPDAVYTQALADLSALDRSRPVFMWLHTLPPHFPYLPPPSTRYRLLPKGALETWSDLLPQDTYYQPSDQALVDMHRARYRESIMAADESLGRLFAGLAASGRLGHSLVIVSADHGESFERGLIGHGGPGLYEALIRVPLLIKLPDQRTARLVETPVSQVDLAPTVLDIAGATAAVGGQGRSLRAALEGASLPEVPVYSMALERESRFQSLSGGKIAMILGGYKVVFDVATGVARLYDLSTDSAEVHDRYQSNVTEAGRMLAILRRELAAAERARQLIND